MIALFHQVLTETKDVFSKNKRLGYSELSTSPTFLPDYFKLSSLGRTPIESFLHESMYLRLHPLWKKIIWKKMCHTIVQTHTRNQFAGFCVPKKDSEAFINMCEIGLYNHSHFFGECTFSDLFVFMNTLIYRFLDKNKISKESLKELKKDQNSTMLDVMEEIRSELETHPQRLALSVYLSIRSNWMDIFENNHVTFINHFRSEISDLLDDPDYFIRMNTLTSELFNISAFTSMVHSAPKTILFESDNSGEIIFDLFLIEQLLDAGHTLILSVKKTPFLNDCLFDEVEDIIHKHFPKLSQSLTNGSLQLSEGKLLSYWPEAFREDLKKADVIIAKGQAHFQSYPLYYTYTIPIFTLFGVRARLTQHCIKKAFPKTIIPKDSVLLLKNAAFRQS
jgi:uncharacterized protein with ATP-grasp and redox domains